MLKAVSTEIVKEVPTLSEQTVGLLHQIGGDHMVQQAEENKGEIPQTSTAEIEHQLQVLHEQTSNAHHLGSEVHVDEIHDAASLREDSSHSDTDHHVDTTHHHS